MSLQLIGPKKHAAIVARTGLPFDRVLRSTNRCWVGRVLTAEGHDHYLIDPIDGSVEREVDPIHWTTCREVDPNYDPFGDGR